MESPVSWYTELLVSLEVEVADTGTKGCATQNIVQVCSGVQLFPFHQQRIHHNGCHHRRDCPPTALRVIDLEDDTHFSFFIEFGDER